MQKQTQDYTHAEGTKDIQHSIGTSDGFSAASGDTMHASQVSQLRHVQHARKYNMPTWESR